MPSAKSNSARWVGIFLVLAIGVALGWKAFQTFEADATIKDQYDQLADQPRQPRLSDEWSVVPVSPDELTRGREMERLRRESYASGESARLWMSVFVGYVGLVGAVTAMFAVMLFLAQAIRRIETNLATGPSPIRDGIAEQIGLAKTAISKGLPRQPTTGLGRLSTADELRKWAVMRDEGLVTEDEFQKMREKLVGKS